MANYGGKQPNNTAYVKNFVYGSPSDLWSATQYNPTIGPKIGVLTPSSPLYENVYIPEIYM